MKYTNLLAPVFLSIFLLASSGCSTTGSVGFREMSNAYRDVLEGYANDNILLNIVRSSENMPLSFLDMPSVVGSGSVSGTLGVNGTVYSASPVGSFSSFFSSGAGSFYSPNASLSVSRNFNFTQSSLDNAQFMTAFLSDISPETIAGLMNNTAGPRSLLYSLVIEHIEVKNADGSTLVKYVNDPYSKDYSSFQTALYRLIDSGLTTESVLTKEPLSPSFTEAEYKKIFPAMQPMLNQPGVTFLRSVNKSGNVTYQLIKNAQSVRMCLIRSSNERPLDQALSDSAFCGASNLTRFKQGEEKTGSSDAKTLAIKIRSTRNVFSFLGQLLYLQTKENPFLVKIKDSHQFVNDPTLVNGPNGNLYPILVVHKNKSVPNPVASVEYRGNSYSIGSDNDDASRQVLVLLAEMLTMNKVPGSIPTSPAVIVR